MKIQPPEDPKQTRRQKTPPGPDVRKAMALGCALATACTGAQVRPEPFLCPEGAVATRKQLRWDMYEPITVVMDDRYGHEDDIWLRSGDTLVGVVPESIRSAQRKVAPSGTRFFGGKVYVSPEKTETGKPGSIIVKYDRVKIPKQDELPVCFIVERHAVELKDGAAKVPNRVRGEPVDFWGMSPDDAPPK